MFRPLKTYQLVVDLVVAGLFALLALPLDIQFGRGTDFTGLALSAVIVTLLMAGALALRRASPGLALGLAWAAAVAQMAFGRSPTPADLAIFAVLYATAAYGSRVVFWLGFASSFVGALVITMYLVLGPYFGSGGMTWSTIPTALAVLVAAGFALLLSWTVGALVRSSLRARESRAAKELAEADAVAEQERVRIARDMHDVVAHSLAVVIAQADGARYALASGGSGAGPGGAGGAEAADVAAAGAALGTIASTARAALADVRVLLTQLRHSEGDGPQPTIGDLEELYAQVRASGVQLRVDVDPAPPGTPPAAVQLAVYRILQEALTNALRHGGGAPVSVRLAWLADRVEFEVRNGCADGAARSGAGDPVSAAAEPVRGGHGIIGMRERAQLAGGTLSAGPLGAEFVVSATIPIGATA